MGRQARSLTKAIDVLRSLAAVYRGKLRYRLPTVAELSARAGVSPVTLCKAVAALKAEGVLSARQGRWVEVAGVRPERPVTPAQPREERWRRIESSIRTEILEGAYPPGAALPSPKELTQKYGTCYRTLKKALTALEQSHTLAPFKKTYLVPSLAGRVSHGTAVLVAVGDINGLLQPFTPRTQELLRTLETECSRIRVNLEIMTHDPRADALFFRGKSANPGRLPVKKDAVLGFMVWAMGLSRERSAGLIRRLLPHGLPVSVFDETGTFDAGALPAFSERFRHFSMANSTLAGNTMGRFLLNLGHRRIAYVSPFHDSQWSRNRLLGVRAAFADAGFPDAVAGFTIDQESYVAEYAVQARSIHTMIDAMASAVYPSSGGERPNPELLALKRQIVDFERKTFRGTLLTLLDQASARKDITAWVGANDDVALEALDFLNQKGVPVPAGVSIVGFDDGLASFLKKLTSYNFNGQAVVRAMLDHLLAPPPASRRRPDPAGPVEIDGFITQRGTTGRARLK